MNDIPPQTGRIVELCDFTSPWEVSKVLRSACMFVCLSVCLSARMSENYSPNFTKLLPRDAMVARYICCRRESVRLSVCHKPALYQNG